MWVGVFQQPAKSLPPISEGTIVPDDNCSGREPGRAFCAVLKECGKKLTPIVVMLDGIGKGAGKSEQIAPGAISLGVGTMSA